jgi:redox-sensing transcriptional repressor
MTPRELQAIPVPTLRRLPTYLDYLRVLHARGRDVVSCTNIAEYLSLDPTQVRKDIECTGIVGRARVGYNLASLVAAIETLLGWNNTSDAFLVGAGSLGAALMGYEGFKDYGLSIVAAFDADPAKIGTEIHGKRVVAIGDLTKLAKRMKIHIGIITTPASEAQAVAERMAAGGIRGIWNFAPARITVPPEVIVENVQLASSLAVLSSKLTAAAQADRQS